MYDPTISDPINDPRSESDSCAQCKGCGEWASADDNRCACNVQCCETCGSACVRFVGESHRFCIECDAGFIADCKGDPECVLETPAQAKRRALKIDAGTHPVFSGGNWMARVAAEVAHCEFDECLEHDGEPTKDIPVESMARMVSR